ncbi:phage tail sheath family protein [Solibacillus sp.]|uniref:phage tail sheath family protein n=1 Tax=Solibacillus sp. TaxID=1909654 RepID=UPI003315B536
MFKHGSRVTEVPTSVSVPVEASATTPVVFGTAPLHLAATTEYVNEPIIAYSFEEAVTALGYSDDWGNYTLCEMMDAAFRQFNVAPIIFVNVLDPEIHKTSGTEIVTIQKFKGVAETKGILIDSLVVKTTQSVDIALEKDVDYIVSYDDDENLVIALVDESTTILSVYIEFDKLAPEMVDQDAIIGGFNIETGKRKGLELINSIFPKFRLVPAQILAPKYSMIPGVAAIMKAKASAVNSYFRSFVWNDIDSTLVNNYQKANEWKSNNNYVGINEATCWPMIALDDKIYHMSTQAACLVMKVANANGGAPFESPSNKGLSMNKMVLKDGTKVDLGPDQAELLNSQGIVTAQNMMNGWVLWGNCTGAFPGNTDVKDIYIPVRITHNWLANSIILTTWNKVDKPINRSLIDNIVDTMNNWFNGLHNRNVILGGRVEFRKADNPTTSLLSGKLRLRYFVAEPVPAQDIENLLEFDPSYYNSLF